MGSGIFIYWYRPTLHAKWLPVMSLVWLDSHIRQLLSFWWKGRREKKGEGREGKGKHYGRKEAWAKSAFLNDVDENREAVMGHWTSRYIDLYRTWHQKVWSQEEQKPNSPLFRAVEGGEIDQVTTMCVLIVCKMAKLFLHGLRIAARERSPFRNHKAAPDSKPCPEITCNLQ